MQHGFVVPNNFGIADPRQLVELAVHAEAQGYHSVWVNHHVLNVGYVKDRLEHAPYHDALVTVSWMGAANLQPGWQAERQKRLGETLLGSAVYPEFEDDGWSRFARNLRTLLAQAGDIPATELEELTQLANYKIMEEIRSRVSDTVQDPAVAEQLKAYYNQFCKRPTCNDKYLETFNRTNVELIDVSDAKGVERISARGVVANGKEYEVDCIVYASGFEITSSYLRRIGIPIYGINGESIYTHWDKGMRTMHGLMSHGFPNLFLCGGLFVFQLGANYCYGVDVQAERGLTISSAVNLPRHS